MKRKLWLCLGLVVILLVGGFFVRRHLMAAADDRASQDQLRLAREEGIPTSAAEFAATIRSATPSENAAPLYRRLREARLPASEKRIPSEVSQMLTFAPSPTALKDADDLLTEEATQLATVDLGTKLSRCWFNRDWAAVQSNSFAQ